MSLFLSTPSARRATETDGVDLLDYLISIHALREEGDGSISTSWPNQSNFYPRPPRGGRRSESWITWEPGKISIHALREEGDCCPRCCLHTLGISIHALREEGDAVLTSGMISTRMISIHALREEGDVNASSYVQKTAEFLSTPSARRAT